MNDKGAGPVSVENAVEEVPKYSPLRHSDLNTEDDANPSSGLRGWFAKPKVKWGIAIAILVVIVFSTVALVTTILLSEDNVTMLKLWPDVSKEDHDIHFVYGSDFKWHASTLQLDDLFDDYQHMKYGSDVVKCQDGVQIKGDQTCRFEIGSIPNDCAPENNYGYTQGTPCIFLQFKEIKDWVPEPYTARELGKYMNLSDKPTGELSSSVDLLYLDCQGTTSSDKENMGPLKYMPVHGFETKYFPYRGQQKYLPPLVGIKFLKPATGVVISLTCKLWAKNIKHTDGVPNDQISFCVFVD